MRYQGKITTWHDDKGFGFVTQNGGGHKAFVHISSFHGRARRPEIGDIIVYELGEDERKRLRAERVAFAEVRKPPPSMHEDRNAGSVIAASVAILFLAMLLVGAALAGRLPFELVLLYLVMSIVTLVVYGLDKSAAMNNRRRTPEDTLHLLALVGGWPGALFAQVAFRHKSRKRGFQITFWVVVILNTAALLWLASDSGNALWRSLK
ncbi:MAG: DUF1294 domain-containing protein [Burkholderiales bacterium]|jgi:uncharacterized membrane protein YsdA (DUF1294 family)/cold shock CspA family protein|nr:cold shock and DUF1294 domain-containing protein [Rhodocyclaceae bacterium]MCA3167744.1 cold shock and DUF1294 domain-containing protein [Burkholderiales bacterium]